PLPPPISSACRRADSPRGRRPTCCSSTSTAPAASRSIASAASRRTHCSTAARCRGACCAASLTAEPSSPRPSDARPPLPPFLEFPPLLWGRVRVGGATGTVFIRCPTPTPTLPHQGGGGIQLTMSGLFDSYQYISPYYTGALAGYFLGSIPFGLLLTLAAGLGDIRRIGSGNIGATNVLRTGRKGLAAATVLLDGGKGAAAVLIGHHWGPDMAIMAGCGATLGHLFPIWLKFKGRNGA